MAKAEMETARKEPNWGRDKPGLLTARRSWACMYSSTSWRPVTVARGTVLGGPFSSMYLLVPERFPEVRKLKIFPRLSYC